MAFSSDVRQEIARVAVTKRCCARAEVCAAVLCSGGLSFRGMGRYGLVIHGVNDEIAGRYIEVLRRFFRCQAALGTIETPRLGGVTRYQVMPPEGEVPRLLRELKLLDNTRLFGLRATPAREVLKDPCCRQSFLRGAYLAGGSTGNPKKAYHMELAVPEPELARCLVQLMKGLGVPARHTRRKTQQVVYLKDGEHMARMLAILGAHRSLLEFENLRILKNIRNEANRQVNCDNANVDKSLAASERQISMIRVIQKKMGLEKLPEPLAEMAELRLRHPDLSLGELGGMANPILSKSGASARMRKLEAIAEELVNG